MSASGDALRRGAVLFDAGRHLEAHETWEEAWRAEPRGTAGSKLLQGLAQCAAAMIKLERGEMRGARSLAQKGATLVEGALVVEGVDAGGLSLIEFAREMRELPNARPKLMRKSADC